MSEDGWIPHDGNGTPPIAVEVRLRNGSIERGWITGCCWWLSEDEPETDIIAYRLVEGDSNG